MKKNHKAPERVDKRRILRQLRSAKSAQIQWRSYTQALASGMEVEPEKISVMAARSKFSRWYHDNVDQLSSLKSFESVARPHANLQQVNRQFLEALYGEEVTTVRSWFKGGLLKRRRREEEVASLVPELVNYSGELLAGIDALEREVSQMSEQELQALVEPEVIDYARVRNPG